MTMQSASTSITARTAAIDNKQEPLCILTCKNHLGTVRGTRLAVDANGDNVVDGEQEFVY